MNRVLIIEDKPSWALTLKKHTDSKNTSVELVDNLGLARAKVETIEYDLIIADLKLSQSQKNIFETLSGISYSLGSENRNQLPPLIIVTGTNLTTSEIIDALNKYPGWICGWHEKDTFDPEDFQKNVISIIELRKERTSFSAPNWWRIVLTVVGLFIIVASIGWIFENHLNAQIESILLTITKATVILGVVIILLAYPDKISIFLPFLKSSDNN